MGAREKLKRWGLLAKHMRSGFALIRFTLLSEFPFPALKLFLALERHLCDLHLTLFCSDHGLVRREGFYGLKRADFVDTHLVFISEPPTAAAVRGPQKGNGADSCTDAPKPEMMLRAVERGFHAF